MESASRDDVFVGVGGAVEEEIADEWMELAKRLLRVSPHKWDDIVRHVRAIVEGQEMLAEADRLLVLRGKRPAKRYRA